jgi:hypothetical protein
VLLGDLLLPAHTNQPNTRQLFQESYRLLGDGEGLRIRLRAPLALAWLPWEFACVPAAGGGAPRFLLLDRRVSLVRRDALAVPAVAVEMHPGPARQGQH